ncbi:MAG: translational GTPase TypA [Candidatus Sericytochromatia bacterium]|nr:translational GTPase TypA [Candidatus Sericytochromatia bacterium]
MSRKIRNIAIIAHVDHGKTTLVDCLLKQSGTFRRNEVVAERVMDSNDLEKERGITILAKNTAVLYDEYHINIVDTPGHADFAGEVERVLSMVNGCLLVVDAFEGPMPQTRFVLRKALQHNLKPIVVLNKIDRDGARPEVVLDKVLDLFIELGATEEQLDFPVVYASAIKGYAMLDHKVTGEDMKPLFDAIIEHVPEPEGDPELPLQLQVTTIDYSEYLGRIVIGRLHHGRIRVGEQVAHMTRTGVSRVKVAKLFGFEGLKRIEIEVAQAGDIIALSGIEAASIGDTIASLETPVALPWTEIEEPTMQMTFCVNNSPFFGQVGKFVTSRHLRDRLKKEVQINVSLRVEETDATDAFLVSGRGELHLGILIETMRREGFEFQVSKPQVIFKEEDGHKVEPFESLVCDVPDAMVGAVIELLGPRRAEMANMMADGRGRTLLEFFVPSRGLFGFRSEFIRLTKGSGVMYHSFHEYRRFAGEIDSQRNGVLISMEEGTCTAYALEQLADRGLFFIKPGERVYVGMIVGENNRIQDMPMNVCKPKKLTNMRAAGGEELVRMTPPREIGLEEALEYINDDELVEVTPSAIRLRKQQFRR